MRLLLPIAALALFSVAGILYLPLKSTAARPLFPDIDRSGEVDATALPVPTGQPAIDGAPPPSLSESHASSDSNPTIQMSELLAAQPKLLDSGDDGEVEYSKIEGADLFHNPDCPVTFEWYQALARDWTLLEVIEGVAAEPSIDALGAPILDADGKKLTREVWTQRLSFRNKRRTYRIGERLTGSRFIVTDIANGSAVSTHDGWMCFRGAVLTNSNDGKVIYLHQLPSR